MYSPLLLKNIIFCLKETTLGDSMSEAGGSGQFQQGEKISSAPSRGMSSSGSRSQPPSGPPVSSDSQEPELSKPEPGQ